MFDPRKIQAIKNVQKLDEFGGSLRQAIKSAGYSTTIANNPKRLTDRKWFKEQLPGYEKTSKAIHELMDSKRLDHYTFPLSISDEVIQEIIEELPGCMLRKIVHAEKATYAYFWKPNDKSKKEAIDIVLKIKGDYAPEKHEFTDPMELKSDEELLQDRQQIERVVALRKEKNGSAI